jgi:hypothetical protein
MKTAVDHDARIAARPKESASGSSVIQQLVGILSGMLISTDVIQRRRSPA